MTANRLLELPEGGGVGIAAGGKGKAKVVLRIITLGIRREASRRAVFKALIHRKYDEPSRPCERTGIHHTRKTRERPRTIRPVPAQYLFYSFFKHS